MLAFAFGLSAEIERNLNLSITLIHMLLPWMICAPALSKRKDDMGNEMEDTLIDKIDIDGDGIAEWIYFSKDYEGSFYQIFSYKSGKWNKS